ncbi:uncharacterized protein LOC117319869 [Pecten maximus]|uniref:uncharacterized protein LOC117319869 n=1 Tax=Pecten maximus TaxID=6579 RepID=UPI0014591923|nr:uncharacterized protein LOC117319869 [Pecten maximus]
MMVFLAEYSSVFISWTVAVDCEQLTMQDQLGVLGAVFAEMGFNPGDEVSEATVKEWIKTKAIKEDPDEQPAPAHTVTVNPAVRISVFSGEEKDTAYDVWRYEVGSLLVTHGEEVVATALRRSLKGRASKVAMNVGPKASVGAIVAKMDSIFGAVEKGETLLAKFFSARQKEGEDVSTWSCRLEDIMNKAVQQGDVPDRNAEGMLRTMFWTGLRREIKDVTGHKYDTVRPFDDLRIAVRQVERDLMQREEETTQGKAADKVKPVAHMAAATDELKEMKGLIQQLTTDMAEMKKTQQKSTVKQSGAKADKGKGSHSNQKKGSQSGYQSNYTQGQQQARFQPQQPNPVQPQHPLAQQRGNPPPPPYRGNEPQCYRCGQYGHIQLGCRANIDHRWEGLNANQSAM